METAKLCTRSFDIVFALVLVEYANGAANGLLRRLAQRAQCLFVRPCDELHEISRRKARNVDDGDPLIAASIPRRLDAGNVRELDEAIE